MEIIPHNVTSAAGRLLFASVVVILCTVTSAPQKGGTNVTGQWVWKQFARTKKSQIQFRLVIRRERNIVRGIYSVDEFVNGKWQGEDGNQTPFVGNIDGSDVKIEFDPLATQPGYERDVTGKIQSGQGTNAILVSMKGYRGQPLTAMVVICGLPDECQNVVSVSSL
ncbi:MAG TPA: hypothetical protein VJ023_10655, partial [Pyrinomonadaceae bacterium]|nr:hypothetical protein [Pyrinomonadaceae bacterium]